MELETINKLFLELSQFATAKTAKELELESRLIDEQKENVLRVLMHDDKKGWGVVASPLRPTLCGFNSFDVRFEDGSMQMIHFKITEM